MKINRQSKSNGLESLITLEQAIKDLEGDGYYKIDTVAKMLEEGQTCHTDVNSYFRER